MPGKPTPSRAPFRLVSSFAFLAASLARLASRHLSATLLAIDGFSSKNELNDSFTIEATRPSTSELPSLVFVCPSNCGSGILIETTAARPSRTSSPESVISSFLKNPLFLQYWFMALVSADLNPLKCDPPSIVFMLLANEKRFSPYPSLYCRATYVWTLSFSPLKYMTFL